MSFIIPSNSLDCNFSNLSSNCFISVLSFIRCTSAFASPFLSLSSFNLSCSSLLAALSSGVPPPPRGFQPPPPPPAPPPIEPIRAKIPANKAANAPTAAHDATLSYKGSLNASNVPTKAKVNTAIAI